MMDCRFQMSTTFIHLSNRTLYWTVIYNADPLVDSHVTILY